jgi:hypothetical protein
MQNLRWRSHKHKSGQETKNRKISQNSPLSRDLGIIFAKQHAGQELLQGKRLDGALHRLKGLKGAFQGARDGVHQR